MGARLCLKMRPVLKRWQYRGLRLVKTPHSGWMSPPTTTWGPRGWSCSNSWCRTSVASHLRLSLFLKHWLISEVSRSLICPCTLTNLTWLPRRRFHLFLSYPFHWNTLQLCCRPHLSHFLWSYSVTVAETPWVTQRVPTTFCVTLRAPIWLVLLLFPSDPRDPSHHSHTVWEWLRNGCAALEHDWIVRVFRHFSQAALWQWLMGKCLRLFAACQPPAPSTPPLEQVA